ncbi:MAG: hypothetical protein ABW133_18265 [Polyangiaceae bacterium]
MVLGPKRVAHRRALAAVVLAAAIFSAERGRADTGRIFELDWQAPAGCPTSAEVEREITRLIGIGQRNRSTVRAMAKVTGKDADWRVQIRLHDGDIASERLFEGSTCRAVTKVASLIIALAIEPNAGSTPEALPPPKEKPEPPPPPAPPPLERREPKVRGMLTAGSFAEFALLPQTAWGFEMGAGVRFPSISIDVRGGATLAQSAEVPTLPAGGKFSLLTAGLRICGRVVPGSTELFVCATGLVDRVSGEGYGVTAPSTATTIFGAAGIGPRLDIALAEMWRVMLAGEATYTFGEASFRLDNVGNVHRTPRFGGSARLSLGFMF